MATLLSPVTSLVFRHKQVTDHDQPQISELSHSETNGHLPTTGDIDIGKVKKKVSICCKAILIFISHANYIHSLVLNASALPTTSGGLKVGVARGKVEMGG